MSKFLVVLSVFSVGMSFGGTCVSGTAASYVALGAGGCTIDMGGNTLLFSNFAFMQNPSGPTVGGSADQINLAPIFTVNTAGLDITPIGTFNAGTTGVNDVELIYIASVVGGANLIDGLNLSITGSADSSNVGGGLAGTDTLTEDFCRGGSLPPGSCPADQGGPLPDFLSITGSASGVTVAHNNTFAATSALSVLKDIQLSGNNGTMASSVTDVKNVVVTVVPEPSMGLVVGLGLCGLGVFRRTRQPNRARVA